MKLKKCVGVIRPCRTADAQQGAAQLHSLILWLTCQWTIAQMLSTHTLTHTQMHLPNRTHNWQSPSPLPSTPVSPPACPSAKHRCQLFWLRATVSQVPVHILSKRLLPVSIFRLTFMLSSVVKNQQSKRITKHC